MAGVLCAPEMNNTLRKNHETSKQKNCTSGSNFAGGDTDTTRRQLLKSSVGALGTLYLAPATLSLLIAERATAQSNQAPTIDIYNCTTPMSRFDRGTCEFTATDDNGLQKCNFSSPNLDIFNITDCTGRSAQGSFDFIADHPVPGTNTITGVATDTSNKTGQDSEVIVLF